MVTHERKGNYGLDSPAIMATLLCLGLSLLLVGHFASHAWRWIAYGFGGYFLFGFGGMLFYSTKGKRGLAENLLNKISWRGDEKVLDVGCGRGLLTVAAAHRLSSGSVVGVDIWNPRAISGNCAESVLENAKLERVDSKVEVKEGDARALPFADGTFDVVVSNFVVHELKKRTDREQMMREIGRVLKPGGRVVLVDFIFTDQCVEDLPKFGVTADRLRDGFFSFWICAILNFGAAKTYYVVGQHTLAGAGAAVIVSES